MGLAVVAGPDRSLTFKLHRSTATCGDVACTAPTAHCASATSAGVASFGVLRVARAMDMISAFAAGQTPARAQNQSGIPRLAEQRLRVCTQCSKRRGHSAPTPRPFNRTSHNAGVRAILALLGLKILMAVDQPPHHGMIAGQSTKPPCFLQMIESTTVTDMSD